ncbi:hypothetical protein GIX10_07875 [Acinetobacter sp. YIM 103518]|uniref:Type I restriction modification DNA specificity domain-containing protein n=1 Tax=Acinetobacter faecalis TaxID=2665161 RepID=A0A6L6GHN8_9GAMM|nr:restriction endonuclease subunit S [Acinetobacter faecalis]MTD11344.1 hypothetical protein [Acinetobacter faecalis]
MAANSLVSGWQNVKLGDIIELKYGKSLPAKDRDNMEFPVYGSNGVVGEHSQPLVKTQGLIIGRKGSYGEVTLSEQPFFPIDTTYYVDELYGQPISYWYYLLKFLPLTQLNRSTAIPGLNREDAYFLEIQLPSLAEQKIIADKLDNLLAQVKSIKARLERIIEILKQFRQSVLAAAVSGKLTEEWRVAKGITIETWKYEAAKNVCEKVQSGSTPRENPFDQDGTVPFLKVYNIVDQKIDFDYKPQFITSETHSKGSCARSVAFPNDVLMNIVGPPLGKVAILTNQFPEWNLNQAITLFRVKKELLDHKYLYYVLCEGALVRNVMPETKGSVGQVNISLSQCREAILPVPSIEEQREVVLYIDKLLSNADVIDKYIQSALDRVNNLTQAILAKAFRGELTAEWREANPELISGENSAEALLERIKAERELAKLATKRGRGKA